jgi:putative ABC transport system ATP-binding protein
VIKLSDVHFEYGGGGFALSVPKLEIGRGQTTAFVGPSGTGKTTLMYLIAGILQSDAGKIEIDGKILGSMSDRQRRVFRISRFGLVFQDFELLEYLSTRENILLPYLINKSLKLTAETRNSAESLAKSVGLGEKMSRRPRELSHGERQRVAVCRALITKPDIIVADEPTSSLDTENSSAIMDIILGEARRREAVFLMLTHDRSLLEPFDMVVDVGELSGRTKK